MKCAKMLLGRKLPNLEPKLKDDSGLSTRPLPVQCAVLFIFYKKFIEAVFSKFTTNSFIVGKNRFCYITIFMCCVVQQLKSLLVNFQPDINFALFFHDHLIVHFDQIQDPTIFLINSNVLNYIILKNWTPMFKT